MIQTLQAKDINLREVRNRFGLTESLQNQFFQQWHSRFSELTETDKNQLTRLQKNYQNLYEQGLSEESVKMVVLSPLLDLAGFYQAPFNVRTEESIELVSEDEGITVRGKIDVLLATEQFWILVVEAKSTQYDVLTALPQALTYMMSAAGSNEYIYGLLVNGREFVFIRLIQGNQPTYSRSFALSVENGEDLSRVLQALKIIRQDVLS